jgi:hypothetical protein
VLEARLREHGALVRRLMRRSELAERHRTEYTVGSGDSQDVRGRSARSNEPARRIGNRRASVVEVDGAGHAVEVAAGRLDSDRVIQSGILSLEMVEGRGYNFRELDQPALDGGLGRFKVRESLADPDAGAAADLAEPAAVSVNGVANRLAVHANGVLARNALAVRARIQAAGDAAVQVGKDVEPFDFRTLCDVARLLGIGRTLRRCSWAVCARPVRLLAAGWRTMSLRLAADASGER